MSKCAQRQENKYDQLHYDNELAVYNVKQQKGVKLPSPHALLRSAALPRW
jgi:hypothetical protein